MQEIRTECFASKQSSTIFFQEMFCYFAKLVLTYFRLMKDRVILLVPETIIAKVLHSGEDY